MAEHLDIAQGSKAEKYAALLPQIAAVVEAETDTIANMANVASMIQETFGFLWTGFYRVTTDDMLILGPFQGPMACTRIKLGRGVCGTAWAEDRTIIVPDVDQFPGHIACSSASRSEIVVPMHYDDEVVGVLDIDSAELNTFDETDKEWLEKIVNLL
ncbi:MAG: GAF domain-containing protein [Bacteroidales bacterium]|nr:GAF domain-containing protein [Bacteroidales bacterium]